MNLPEAGLVLAGFTLAHAAWNVSELPRGELLVPLAVIEQSGQRKVVRFEAQSQEAAIAKGKAAMGQLGSSADAWAFAREGLFREGGKAVDVLTVDFWAKGMKQPASLVQRYEPFSKKGKFRILGEPMLVVEGVAQQPQDARALLPVVARGIQQHPKVVSLWPTWR